MTIWVNFLFEFSYLLLAPKRINLFGQRTMIVNLYFRILKARDYSCKCNLLAGWKDDNEPFEMDRNLDSFKNIYIM